MQPSKSFFNLSLFIADCTKVWLMRAKDRLVMHRIQCPRKRTLLFVWLADETAIDTAQRLLQSHERDLDRCPADSGRKENDRGKLP